MIRMEGGKMKSHVQRQLVWFLIGLLFGMFLLWKFSEYALFVAILALVILGVLAAIKYRLWQRIQNARSSRPAAVETPPQRTRSGPSNRY